MTNHPSGLHSSGFFPCGHGPAQIHFLFLMREINQPPGHLLHLRPRNRLMMKLRKGAVSQFAEEVKRQSKEKTQV
jgi:hypothetical protein